MPLATTPRPAQALADLLTVDDIASLLRVEVERRSSPRFAFQVTQRVAAWRDGDLPPTTAFRAVACKDISMGGISFYLASPPDADFLLVELTRGATTLLVLARVLGSAPVVGLEPYQLVRCRFVERIE